MTGTRSISIATNKQLLLLYVAITIQLILFYNKVMVAILLCHVSDVVECRDWMSARDASVVARLTMYLVGPALGPP